VEDDILHQKLSMPQSYRSIDVLPAIQIAAWLRCEGYLTVIKPETAVYSRKFGEHFEIFLDVMI